MSKWNRRNMYRYLVLGVLTLAGLLGWPRLAHAETDQTLDVLRIGTHTYHNVTVTTKNKDYIFILYSGGMTSVKVCDLSPEIRKQLGYVMASASAPETNAAKAWAKHTLAKLESPQIKGVESQVVNTWRAQLDRAQESLPPLTPKLLVLVLGIAVAVHLFFCFCCLRICQKVGQEPGILVWLPLLQLFPMLRAAGMSGWWFFLFLLPGINLLAQIVWSVKITNARGKNTLLAILLILPPFSVLAFLYLAFADSAPPKIQERPTEIMTLETA